MEKKTEEIVLKKNFMPSMSMVFGFLSQNKFINMSINKMEEKDIEEVRAILLNDVKELKDKNQAVQKQQLQKIFSKIFALQPYLNQRLKDRSLRSTEQRLYADLILTPGLFDLDYVDNFIRNDFVNNEKNRFKYESLIEILDYRKGLSDESREKFDYCYRSSVKFANSLINNPNIISHLLTERNLQMFSKETLSHIFRFLNSGEDISNLFAEENSKVLFIFSQMCDAVYKKVGHESEVLDAGYRMLRDADFKEILNDYYDKYVGSQDNENDFKKRVGLANSVEMQELFNYMVTQGYNFSYGSKTFSDIHTIEEFMNFVREERENNHIVVFGKENYERIKNGHLDDDITFKKITDEDELKEFKKAVLENIYGINTFEASHITRTYGNYLEELQKCLNENDKVTFEILEAIVKIDKMELDNEDDIKHIQRAYWKYVKEKGLDHRKEYSSILVLDGLLNRMYMNTYSDILFDEKDKRTIRVDDGVPVIDAGVEFNMIVTALNGAQKFLQRGVNIASKWNTAMMEDRQGLCASFINNSNLGTITLNGPLLGFKNLPKDCLNAMGTTDIYTTPGSFNLRYYNRSHTLFVPGPNLADETRYGYNEMLLDRFLSKDEDNQLKLQPDYVIYYKTEEPYQTSMRYEMCLKTAKEFGIPLVVVDYEKIKKNEKKVIHEMEQELFSKEEVNKDLLVDIMSRYMNNISGTRTIHGPTKFGGLHVKDEDTFPTGDLRIFINDVERRCEYITDAEKKEKWIEAFEAAYENEQRKHFVAVSVNSYNCSIGADKVEFMLMSEYDVGNRIKRLKKVEEETIEEEGIFYKSRDVPGDMDALCLLSNALDFNTQYDIVEKYNDEGEYGYYYQVKKNSKEPSIEEKLIVSYLTDNYDTDLLKEMHDDIKTKNVKFNIPDNRNLTEHVMSSPIFSNVQYDQNKLDGIIEKIEKMNEKDFINLFGAHIVDKSDKYHIDVDTVAYEISLKKSSIREDFNNLNNFINKGSEEIVVKGK